MDPLPRNDERLIATCKWEELMRMTLGASAAACMLIAGLAVTSAQAQNAQPAGAMGGSTGTMGSSMVGTMSPGDYMQPGFMMGKAGEWMLGFQAIFDNMAGSLVGTAPISNEKILQRYASTPTDMQMQMYMLMAMYAPSDDLTLMTILPYIQKSMNNVSSMGAHFVERTDGIGDIELRGLYSIYKSANLRHRVILTAGVALPTGSIDKSMGGMRLEYPMQIGSGTVSLLPGLVYVGTESTWSWGGQFGTYLRLGSNSNGYTLGDRYRLSFWGARELTDWLAVSLRADGEWWGNIRGADPLLNPGDAPTNDPTLQGGKRVDLLLGATVHPTEGLLKGHQFFIEAGAPVYESLDGPQLRRSWIARVSWQRGF
jgi:hypothetical protein